ncbi:hypothetical protein OIV83_002825 [Microbotryomycetes sp. JL201]|nr:hypothetical protein OIV83_002825 [Microbotryomycetes sp. JL201]
MLFDRALIFVAATVVGCAPLLATAVAEGAPPPQELGLASDVLSHAIHLSLGADQSESGLQARLSDNKDDPLSIRTRDRRRATAKSCTLTSQCSGQPKPPYSHAYCDPKTKSCTFRCNSGYTLNGYTKKCVKNVGSKTSTSVTTTKASTASATATVKISSQKKGLGYNTAKFVKPFSDKNSLAWAYNWANSETWGNQPSLNPNVEFVPMLWGKDATGWSTAATKAISEGSKHLLGFNEPDLGSQSNISPTEAANLWKLHMQPFAGKAKLVSPAITNGAPPNMGTGWLDQFLAACTSCRIDAIAIHWYDAAWNTGYFMNYLTDISNKYKKPIWLTEFAGSGTVTEQQAFFKKVIPWMESQSFVERYAAFGAFEGTFVNADASLRPLGLTYADTV